MSGHPTELHDNPWEGDVSSWDHIPALDGLPMFGRRGRAASNLHDPGDYASPQDPVSPVGDFRSVSRDFWVRCHSRFRTNPAASRIIVTPYRCRFRVLQDVLCGLESVEVRITDASTLDQVRAALNHELRVKVGLNVAGIKFPAESWLETLAKLDTQEDKEFEPQSPDDLPASGSWLFRFRRHLRDEDLSLSQCILRMAIREQGIDVRPRWARGALFFLGADDGCLHSTELEEACREVRLDLNGGCVVARGHLEPVVREVLAAYIQQQRSQERSRRQKKNSRPLNRLATGRQVIFSQAPIFSETQSRIYSGRAERGTTSWTEERVAWGCDDSNLIGEGHSSLLLQKRTFLEAEPMCSSIPRCTHTTGSHPEAAQQNPWQYPLLRKQFHPRQKERRHEKRYAKEHLVRDDLASDADHGSADGVEAEGTLDSTSSHDDDDDAAVNESTSGLLDEGRDNTQDPQELCKFKSADLTRVWTCTVCKKRHSLEDLRELARQKDDQSIFRQIFFNPSIDGPLDQLPEHRLPKPDECLACGGWVELRVPGLQNYVQEAVGFALTSPIVQTRCAALEFLRKCVGNTKACDVADEYFHDVLSHRDLANCHKVNLQHAECLRLCDAIFLSIRSVAFEGADSSRRLPDEAMRFLQDCVNEDLHLRVLDTVTDPCKWLTYSSVFALVPGCAEQMLNHGAGDMVLSAFTDTYLMTFTDTFEIVCSKFEGSSELAEDLKAGDVVHLDGMRYLVKREGVKNAGAALAMSLTRDARIASVLSNDSTLTSAILDHLSPEALLGKSEEPLQHMCLHVLSNLVASLPDTSAQPVLLSRAFSCAVTVFTHLRLPCRTIFNPDFGVYFPVQLERSCELLVQILLRIRQPMDFRIARRLLHHTVSLLCACIHKTPFDGYETGPWIPILTELKRVVLQALSEADVDRIIHTMGLGSIDSMLQHAGRNSVSSWIPGQMYDSSTPILIEADAFQDCGLSPAVIEEQLVMFRGIIREGSPSDAELADGARKLDVKLLLRVAFSFHDAVQYEKHEFIGWLKEHGADIDAVNVWRVTPLMLAVSQNKICCVAQLLLHGARPDIHDVQGSTPLRIGRSLLDKARARDGKSQGGNDSDEDDAVGKGSRHYFVRGTCLDESVEHFTVMDQLLMMAMKDYQTSAASIKAVALREEGNLFYKLGHYASAITLYTESLQFHEDCRSYANRAACHMQLDDFDKAIDDCFFSVQIDESYEKGWYRLVQALQKNSDMPMAKHWCLVAAQRCPHSQHLKRALEGMTNEEEEPSGSAMMYIENRSFKYLAERCLDLAIRNRKDTVTYRRVSFFENLTQGARMGW